MPEDVGAIHGCRRRPHHPSRSLRTWQRRGCFATSGRQRWRRRPPSGGPTNLRNTDGCRHPIHEDYGRVLGEERCREYSRSRIWVKWSRGGPRGLPEVTRNWPFSSKSALETGPVCAFISSVRSPCCLRWAVSEAAIHGAKRRPLLRLQPCSPRPTLCVSLTGLNIVKCNSMVILAQSNDGLRWVGRNTQHPCVA